MKPHNSGLARAASILIAAAVVSAAFTNSAFAAGTDKVHSMLTAAAAHYGVDTASASSMRTVASVTAPRSHFTTDVRVDADGNMFFRQAHADRTTEIGMRNGVLSTVTEEQEAVAVGPQVTSFVASHAFHWNSLHAEDVFTDFEFQGEERFGDELALAISASGHGGQPTRLLMRKSNKLPLGMMVLPAGEEAWIRAYFRDWVDIDGGRAFSTAVIVHGADIYTYKYVQIDFGGLSPGDFELP